MRATLLLLLYLNPLLMGARVSERRCLHGEETLLADSW